MLVEPVCIVDEGLPFGSLAAFLLVAHPSTAVLCVVAVLELVIGTCVRQEAFTLLLNCHTKSLVLTLTSFDIEPIREHPFSTYADFPAFLTASSTLVRFSSNLSVLSYAYFLAF